MPTDTPTQSPLMTTLIDALLAEDFFDAETVSMDTAPSARTAPATLVTLAHRGADHTLWSYPLPDGQRLAMVVRPGRAQRLERVPNSPVQLFDDNAVNDSCLTMTSPETLMRHLAHAAHPDTPEPSKGEQVFIEALATSDWQLARSRAHRIDTRSLLKRSPLAFFTAMEQWASLSDRPYHPTAKAKEGLDEAEYMAYMAEFDQTIELRWVAVAKHTLATGDAVDPGDCPAAFVMAPGERNQLERELHAKGLAEDYIALPVHPWQLEHALPRWLNEAFRAEHCVVLDVRSPTWKASSSLRSLLPTRASRHSLKLPMAVHSLGASRYLPAVKMINGDLSAALLGRAKTLDARLGEALHLCDEGRWWAYLPEDASLFDDAPRHLSAMVRSYPASVMNDPASRPLPMATLGTALPEGGRHFFDDWLAYLGERATLANVTRLMRAVCDPFFELTLRLFRLGMLPEVHGQNAVLVWRQGVITGMVLRDHDSLRIAVSQLEQVGLEDPEYRIKPGHANTLYHDDLEALLFWLQTLAIQVNVRAIVDVTASHFDIPPAALWQTVHDSLRHQIETLPLADDVRACLTEGLFEAAEWPFKQLITPIIARAGGPGSMPFGTGRTVNPLHAPSHAGHISHAIHE
ncbi:IucA/IucC family protein [Larsenimonas salina]|uniref:IucA/IucC family protein n=1 Tax=Larsenimonas salina TaxID=1295565 RepID=UPI0020738A34|nr:IucA/IucC family protein [Larsenimonas salina]MCM5704503.1 AcsA protein [Larsenimonas salina]